MKKIRRGILCTIAAVIVIGLALVGAKVFRDDSKNQIVRPTVTDASGNVYLAAEDESGGVYAAVTDSSGNIWAAQINDDGSVGSTVASLNDKFTLDDIPNNYSGPQINETAENSDYIGQVNTVPATTAPAATDSPSVSSDTQQTTKPQSAPDVTTTTPAAPSKEEELYIFKYRDIFAGGCYMMDFSMPDEELGMTELTCAAKGGNILVKTTLDGMTATILYLAEKDTNYVVIEQLRMYGKLTEEMTGEGFDMTELNMADNFAKDVTASEVTVSDAEINGKMLRCESYTVADGTTMKYYFDNGTLVRMDSVDLNGTVTSTYITRITTDVSDDLFKIPSGYIYINFSLLGL